MSLRERFRLEELESEQLSLKKLFPTKEDVTVLTDVATDTNQQQLEEAPAE